MTLPVHTPNQIRERIRAGHYRPAGQWRELAHDLGGLVPWVPVSRRESYFDAQLEAVEDSAEWRMVDRDLLLVDLYVAQRRGMGYDPIQERA